MKGIKTLMTIQKEATGEYRERSSKFLAYLHPVKTFEDLSVLVRDIKRQHPKARHVCLGARILNDTEVEERADDAGEPSGTAGRPILGVLQRYHLLNCACIVVRYYGGTKLGKPGLINAYRNATEDAIAHARIIRKEAVIPVDFTIPYHYQATLLDSCSKMKYPVLAQTYGESATIRVGIPATGYIQKILDLLKDTVSHARSSIGEYAEEFGIQCVLGEKVFL